jgi:hypothetical protein
MENPAFISSPPITPARLQTEADLFEKFAHPKWARFAGPVRDDLSLAETPCCLIVGTKREIAFLISGISLAILFEVTRYGNSVTTNTTGKRDEPEASWSLKVTFSRSKTSTLRRLVCGAGSGTAVMRQGALRSQAASPAEVRGMLEDHRLENFYAESAGRPSKAARAVAISEACKAAKRSGVKETTIDAYAENLRNLFEFHDQTYGLIDGLGD